MQFIEHAVGSANNSWRVIWAPPATDVGTVSVYVAGIVGDGNREPNGDDLYTGRYDLAFTAGEPPGPSALAEQNCVVTGASFQPASAASSWISIFGVNLSTSTRMWRQTYAPHGTALPRQSSARGETYPLARLIFSMS